MFAREQATDYVAGAARNAAQQALVRQRPVADKQVKEQHTLASLALGTWLVREPLVCAAYACGLRADSHPEIAISAGSVFF